MLVTPIRCAGATIPQQGGSLQAAKGHQVRRAAIHSRLGLKEASANDFQTSVAGCGGLAQTRLRTGSQGRHPCVLAAVQRLWAAGQPRLCPQLGI